MQRLTAEEERLSEEAVLYVKENKKSIIDDYASVNLFLPENSPASIFMAGSPGAGKTEFSERFLENFKNEHDGQQIVCINPDKIREDLPQYTGGNAHLFQKAVSVAVSNVLNSVLSKGQPFLLDGTLSNFDKAKENIERCLKRKRDVYIFYIYQDPLTAWRFTQKREKKEGRKILLDTFIAQYFSSKETVNKLKDYFGTDINLILVHKDADHKILRYERNIQTIDAYIKLPYTEDKLYETITSYNTII